MAFLAAVSIILLVSFFLSFAIERMRRSGGPYIWKLRRDLWRLSKAHPRDSHFFTVKIRQHRAVRHSAAIFVPAFWEYVNFIHLPDAHSGFLSIGAVKTTRLIDAYMLAKQQALQMAATGRSDFESAQGLGRQ
jgi:hypothetical protein